MYTVYRRAKEHEKLAKFAANLYKTVRGLTALSPLYVFSAEAFTDIYLEAEDYRKSILSQDKREQDKLIEKRLVNGRKRNYSLRVVYFINGSFPMSNYLLISHRIKVYCEVHIRMYHMYNIILRYSIKFLNVYFRCKNWNIIF